MARGAASIVVLSDPEGRAYANGLADALRGAGHRVASDERQRFPIADSLPATLLGIAARCDLAVAVLSASQTSKAWVARELGDNAALYPSFLLAVAPGWSDWVARLDDASFRVLAPGGGVVARVDDWLWPAPRPPESPPLGRWVEFDPTWIARTVMDRRPDRGDVARALARCTRTIWDAPFYQSFIGPKLTAAQNPTKETLVVKDRVAGLVSIHVAVDDRISALGYLGRVPLGRTGP